MRKERGEREKVDRKRRGASKQGSRHKEFSLFSDNLSPSLDSFTLRRIFQRFGEIVDVYIPRRTGKKSHRYFGFVRFKKEDQAQRALEAMHRQLIRGSRYALYRQRMHQIVWN